MTRSLALLLFGLASLFQIRAEAQIFSEDFQGFTAPVANFNGLQHESGLQVAFGGDLPGWSKSGGGVVHAVNSILPPPPPSADYAVMVWQDNVITLNSPVAGSNNSGETYSVDFLAGPAVYQLPAQATTDSDGLLIEVLRANDSVLASFTHMPGSWAGDLVMNSNSFSYVGDGSGDIRLRVGPSSVNSGHFGGAIDDLNLSGLSELFAEDFAGFTAPPANFNGNQFESGLPVAHSGDLPQWDKAGGGTVHVVNRELPPPPAETDFAVMIWEDNVITLESPMVASNELGKTYSVDFAASPAVYQAPSQVTTEDDGVLIEVLRADDTILASYTHKPGAWAGDLSLVHDAFQYAGDGTGDVRLRIGPSNVGSGHFGGAIDNVMVTVVPEPTGFITGLMAIGYLVIARRRR